MLELMWEGGLRPGEVLGLQLDDISYGRRRVTVRRRPENRHRLAADPTGRRAPPPTGAGATRAGGGLSRACPAGHRVLGASVLDERARCGVAVAGAHLRVFEDGTSLGTGSPLPASAPPRL